MDTELGLSTGVWNPSLSWLDCFVKRVVESCQCVAELFNLCLKLNPGHVLSQLGW